MLPTAIEMTASAASAGFQSWAMGPSATSNSRASAMKAAALVATAMKAVIGVGAPS